MADVTVEDDEVHHLEELQVDATKLVTARKYQCDLYARHVAVKRRSGAVVLICRKVIDERSQDDG